MARKVRGFERVLDAPALFAIAYGEIGSSIYVALGIVAASALGLTPLVLAVTGLVFCLVALSYAEGTAAIPETGGAETFTRRAYNDLVGFVTGWALFLDYLIVIALSALFLPHYLGAALGADALRDRPWDIVVAVSAIALIGVVRLARRTRLHRPALAVALLDLLVQSLIVVLGLALLFSPSTLVDGLSLAPGQDWLDDLLFAIPLGFLAYTGLETVANLAEEAREPGRTLPRSLFSAIGLVVLLTVLVAVVGVTAFPAADDGTSELGSTWLEAPARRDRDRVPGRASRGSRGRAPDRGGALLGAHPHDGDHDVDLGLRTPRPLDGDSRHVAALRSAGSSAGRSFARDDRRDHHRRDRDRARRRRDRGRGEAPREHLLLRRAARLHARPAGRDPAAPARARPSATLPRPARRADRAASTCRSPHWSGRR